MPSVSSLNDAASPISSDISGSLEACLICNSPDCCFSGKIEKNIDPPFLSSFDVARISSTTGLNPESYSNAVVNPFSGKEVRLLKITPDKQCYFLDSGKCKIHGHRPIDCRLFPLDIKIQNNTLVWVIYHYDNCNLTERDVALLISQGSQAILSFGLDMEDYATLPLPKMSGIAYTVLGPVALNKAEATA